MSKRARVADIYKIACTTLIENREQFQEFNHQCINHRTGLDFESPPIFNVNEIIFRKVLLLICGSVSTLTLYHHWYCKAQ